MNNDSYESKGKIEGKKSKSQSKDRTCEKVVNKVNVMNNEG